MTNCHYILSRCREELSSGVSKSAVSAPSAGGADAPSQWHGNCNAIARVRKECVPRIRNEAETSEKNECITEPQRCSKGYHHGNNHGNCRQQRIERSDDIGGKKYGSGASAHSRRRDDQTCHTEFTRHGCGLFVQRHQIAGGGKFLLRKQVQQSSLTSFCER